MFTFTLRNYCGMLIVCILLCMGMLAARDLSDMYNSVSHEGTFLVEDKYTKGGDGPGFTLVLSDHEENMYIVRVSEEDYIRADIKEEIYAKFTSYKHKKTCNHFHMVGKNNMEGK